MDIDRAPLFLCDCAQVEHAQVVLVIMSNNIGFHRHSACGMRLSENFEVDNLASKAAMR